MNTDQLVQHLQAAGDSEAPPVPVTAGPGDSVMLCLTRELNPAEMRSWRQALQETFPGVRFVVVGSVSNVIVGKHTPDTAPEAKA